MSRDNLKVTDIIEALGIVLELADANHLFLEKDGSGNYYIGDSIDCDDMLIDEALRQERACEIVTEFLSTMLTLKNLWGGSSFSEIVRDIQKALAEEVRKSTKIR